MLFVASRDGDNGSEILTMTECAFDLLGVEEILGASWAAAPPLADVRAGKATVSINMAGEAVTYVQALVGVVADGKFGEKTSAAVKQFQKAHSLQETGVVDQATMAALEGSGWTPPSLETLLQVKPTTPLLEVEQPKPKPAAAAPKPPGATVAPAASSPSPIATFMQKAKEPKALPVVLAIGGALAGGLLALLVKPSALAGGVAALAGGGAALGAHKLSQKKTESA